MSNYTPPIPPTDPPHRNAAVRRCCDAWRACFQKELARGESAVMAAHEASKAYRSAMPDLAGHANIQDFIACTAYGMLMNTIATSEATKLLYAAQVALSTLRSEPKAPPPSLAPLPQPAHP